MLLMRKRDRKEDGLVTEIKKEQKVKNFSQSDEMKRKEVCLVETLETVNDLLKFMTNSP